MTYTQNPTSPTHVPVLTEAQQQARAALDKVMNCRFSNFDAGAVIHWAERGMYQVKTEPAPTMNLEGFDWDRTGATEWRDRISYVEWARTDGVSIWLPNMLHPDQVSSSAAQSNVTAYRFLVEGDLIEATDEFIGNDGQTWARPSGWEVGMEYPSHVFKSARRLVSPSPSTREVGSE